MFDNKNHQKPQLIELMQPFRTPPRKGPEPKNMDSTCMMLRFLWSSYKLCLLLGCDLSNIIESQAISDFLWWKQIFLKWVDNGISNNLPSSSRESLRVVKAFRKFCLAIWCPKRSTQQPWCQSFFGIFFLVSSSHQLATATCQRLRPLDRWPSSILLIDGTIKSI